MSRIFSYARAKVQRGIYSKLTAHKQSNRKRLCHARALRQSLFAMSQPERARHLRYCHSHAPARRFLAR
jgi:hypothetical protein